MAGERKSLLGADRPLELPLQWPMRQLCAGTPQAPEVPGRLATVGGAALAQGSPAAQVTPRSAVSVSPQHLGWTETKEPPV